MKRVRVAAATLNQTPLAWDENRAHILGAIEAARADQVGILCLPELCITGYNCEDAFLAPGIQHTALEMLESLADQTIGLVVSVGLPLRHEGNLYNASALLVNGAIVGAVAKRFLASDGIHYEPRWFRPWPAAARTTIRLGGREVPFGDVHFNVGGVRLGFEICEDAWVEDRPGHDLARRGVNIILNPSASHFAFGKHETRTRLVTEASRLFGVTYVYSNLLGNEAGRAIYDGDCLIASGGKVVADGPRFSFRDWSLASATVEIPQTTQREPHANEVDSRFQIPEIAPQQESVPGAPWELSPTLKEEEFTRAMALGLFDYVRKSHSRGFVVSMSGGADSSAIACLIGYMIQLAHAEIGEKGLREKFAYWKGLPSTALTEQHLASQMLTGLYQSTRNSGETTLNAARAVCKEVGGTFHVLDVDNLVTGYTSKVEAALGQHLTWEADDIALQNIQARVRSPGAWMIANIRGALLLATSNRSEAAVGYATMDGDTSGGLSPIAGIDKAFLRHWLRWVERVGPNGLGPYPSIALVNAQQPTAELRPASQHQTDETDLMPYEVLDVIERAAIRDKQVPSEVFDTLRARYPNESHHQLFAWIERFFRLWSRNQWKRERYAPSFHLDDESLDPKTWCRFPILSGGFERELAQLRAKLK